MDSTKRKSVIDYTGHPFMVVLAGIGLITLLAAQVIQPTTAPFLDDFRVTASTGDPAPASDVLAATTLYLTPYTGNRITLFDGSGNPEVCTSAQVSIAVPATTSQMYDVWAYDSTFGTCTVTLELLAWTNDTTRATAIARTSGRYFKSGNTTRLYVASARTTTVSGQTEDSLTKRFVWNYYNRVIRSLRKAANTTGYNYNGVYRQAGADTSHQLEVVIGASEDLLHMGVVTDVFTSVASTIAMVHIGEDSTSTPATESQAGQFQTPATTVAIPVQAILDKVAAAGYHKYVWLEFASAATTSWTGATGGTGTPHNGMSGWMQD